jgi:hypothetical protein
MKLRIEHHSIFYHGTRRGNCFAEYSVAFANTGVGANAYEQGNVFYLTNCPATAQWFADKAQTMALLRSWPHDRMGDWPPPADDLTGDVLCFGLRKQGRVKHIQDMPRGVSAAAIQLGLAALEGYDAVMFHDRGFETVEGDPRVVPLYRGSLPPVTMIPLHEKALIYQQYIGYTVRSS